ncbi:hypothetical protein MRX96_017251 [Rhipicephalus microplus]
MEGLRPLDHLVFSGNITENRHKFRQRFGFYLEATESEWKHSQKQKVAFLLHITGSETIEVFDTLGCTVTKKESYNTVLRKFESYRRPRTYEIFEWYLFRKHAPTRDSEVLRTPDHNFDDSAG